MACGNSPFCVAQVYGTADTALALDALPPHGRGDWGQKVGWHHASMPPGLHREELCEQHLGSFPRLRPRGGTSARSTNSQKGVRAMIDRRILLSVVLSASMLVVGGIAVAKNQHHNNGHNLLGAKLNQNGKHE